MDNDQFLDAYLNTLETSEGAGGGDTVTGMATREYGVKNLLGVNEEDYKNNPKGLAKAVAQKNIDELIDMGIDWNSLPLSMKFNALDIQYNMGSLKSKAPNYFKALKSGNYADAIKESLDAIGAYDPKRKGERPTKGIALRRAMFYNMAATELNLPTITSVNAINQDNPQKSAKVTYNMSEGDAIPITYEFQSLHSTTKPGTIAVDGMVVEPKTEVEEGFKETDVVKPDDVVEPGTTDMLEEVEQQQFQRSVDAADRDEQKQQAADLEIIRTKDVAPETTDAIPVIDVPAEEPKQPGLFDKVSEGVSSFMDMFSSEDREAEKEQVRKDLLKELEIETIRPPAMNEGGMAMDRQMSMFEDGGLMDEGGTTDPVSGNEVPPGSTQEEVRDDIPAQLSEGEFVFPADVVRFIGLEKLMNLRQEAKAGLARMEAMGQMGNSEEATIPDDIPFTLDDLDMEDDPMEFQVGGLVPNQFGVMEQPSQFTPTYQAPVIPVAQPVQQAQPLQTGFTPLTTPAVPTGGATVPTFEQLMPTTTGSYDELKEYINNETGQTMTIPFVDGKPIYPIPTGFVEVQTDVVEAVDPEETIVPTARPETVTGRDDPSDDQRMDDGLGPGGGRITLGGEIFEGPTGFYGDGIKTRKIQGSVYGGTKVGVSFDMPSGIPGVMSGLSTAVGLATGKGIAKDATATFTLANETVTVDAVKYNKIKAAGFRGEEAEKVLTDLQNKSRITATLRDRSKVKRQLEKAKETGDINKAAAAELKLAQIEATKMGVSIDGKTTSELKSETLAAVQRKAAENAARKAAEQAANQGNTQYESDKGGFRYDSSDKDSESQGGKGYSFESYSDNVAKGTEDRGYGAAYDSDVLGLAD